MRAWVLWAKIGKGRQMEETAISHSDTVPPKVTYHTPIPHADTTRRSSNEKRQGARVDRGQGSSAHKIATA
jgi:hypothetical protein